jgi:hypothetical protein
MRKKNPYGFVRNVVLYIALVWLVGQAVSVYDHRSHVRAEECVTKYGCQHDPVYDHRSHVNAEECVTKYGC